MTLVEMYHDQSKRQMVPAGGNIDRLYLAVLEPVSIR
jgi:hypothetical protein